MVSLTHAKNSPRNVLFLFLIRLFCSLPHKKKRLQYLILPLGDTNTITLSKKGGKKITFRFKSQLKELLPNITEKSKLPIISKQRIITAISKA